MNIRQALKEKDEEAIQQFCSERRPREVAESLSELGTKEIKVFLLMTDHHTRADLFEELEENLQQELIKALPLRRFAEIVTFMAHDRRADLVATLPKQLRRRLLPALAHAEREDIRRLASYPDQSAGAVMTSDYMTLPPHLTVKQAIEQLRVQALDRETIYTSYIVDRERKLQGVLSLRDLVLTSPRAKIASIMHREVIYGNVDDDQEEVAKKIQKYDLLALPIVDVEGRLAGIVTYDDAADIISQEYTEDIEKLMAITGPHKVGGYLDKGAFSHFQNRVFWVLSLAIVGLVSGYIIHTFEATLSHAIILALYLPMVADTGGNVGSQSAAVVIRALSLGEVSLQHFFRVLWKECRISLQLALVLALFAYAKVYFLSQASTIPPGLSLELVALAIALALAAQAVSSALIGASLPMLATRFGLDPAVVASPALTTIVDATGLLIYFMTAKAMLGL